MIFSEYFCVFCPPRQPFRTVSDVFFAPFPLSICPRRLFLSLRTFVCSRLPRPVPPFFVLCAVRRSLSCRIPSSRPFPRRPLRVPFSFVILPSATPRGVPCRACFLCRLLPHVPPCFRSLFTLRTMPISRSYALCRSLVLTHYADLSFKDCHSLLCARPSQTFACGP